MINKIRQFFGMRQKYVVCGVTVYLPHSPSTVTYIEMRAKNLPFKKSHRITQYLMDEGFVPKNRPTFVTVKQ